MSNFGESIISDNEAIELRDWIGPIGEDDQDDDGRGEDRPIDPDKPFSPEDGIALRNPQEYGRIALSAA